MPIYVCYALLCRCYALAHYDYQVPNQFPNPMPLLLNLVLILSGSTERGRGLSSAVRADRKRGDIRLSHANSRLFTLGTC
jgi:hypothetical protein